MEGECENTSQTFVGNGKKIELSTNSGVLRIVGNNCFVTVARNQGQIVIVGNKGHLQVTENTGYIGYTGNSGLIEVGTTSKGIGRVVYTGNGGTVKRMKTNEVSGKCGVGRSSAKNPPPAKQEDGQQSKKVDVQSELRVNGVEVCINSKSKQGIREGVTKENISPEKLKTSSTAPVGSCSHQARRVFLQTSRKSGEQKTARIQMPRQRNIQVVNVSNFDLTNWCLNLATELVAS